MPRDLSWDVKLVDATPIDSSASPDCVLDKATQAVQNEDGNHKNKQHGPHYNPTPVFEGGRRTASVPRARTLGLASGLATGLHAPSTHVRRWERARSNTFEFHLSSSDGREEKP
ncbi:hypothetical protein LMH87_003647 [Akanthomyces muscarius]|uniref:Uncharacterized protein n=1 Tax=Akanthomyces muscarius TaxID=2231603 RepID=A0A9W8UEV4_AKAMU|nr:hypothetical protein LMH87_003647 [Akanthomyces muscarius]KAJ4144777.1 hypothetical protein LMH87_003647 [Akanthomyces muscarius]